MQITTAINVIQKEADFLGMPILETLEDIKKHGRMVYSEKTMEAFNVIFEAGQAMFAEI
jgi:hypothetical protein